MLNQAPKFDLQKNQRTPSLWHSSSAFRNCYKVRPAEASLIASTDSRERETLRQLSKSVQLPTRGGETMPGNASVHVHRPRCSRQGEKTSFRQNVVFSSRTTKICYPFRPGRDLQKILRETKTALNFSLFPSWSCRVQGECRHSSGIWGRDKNRASCLFIKVEKGLFC